MLGIIKSAQQVWISPDGQRKLYTVVYVGDDSIERTVKTWSGKIAEGINQQFDLDIYEKPGKNGGSETFVRQVQAEGSQYAKPAGAPAPQGGTGAAEKQFKGDPDTRASIERQTGLKAAVDVVANYYNTVGIQPEGLTLESYVADVTKYAKVLGEAASAVPAALAEAFPGATAVENDEPFPSNNGVTPTTQGSLV